MNTLEEQLEFHLKEVERIRRELGHYKPKSAPAENITPVKLSSIYKLWKNGELSDLEIKLGNTLKKFHKANPNWKPRDLKYLRQFCAKYPQDLKDAQLAFDRVVKAKSFEDVQLPSTLNPMKITLYKEIQRWKKWIAYRE